MRPAHYGKQRGQRAAEKELEEAMIRASQRETHSYASRLQSAHNASALHEKWNGRPLQIDMTTGSVVGEKSPAEVFDEFKRREEEESASQV
ncbi:hypothetical protein HK102_000780 [Quaeritorhiza haematococci]|nr:hypothetical protein HK102_000780 [Quaeritorhiza haematococci]